MKKLVCLLGVFSLFGVMGVVPVSADDTGYNPPPAVADNCDAGHGAFGAFSHHFAAYGGINWIAQDAKEDGGMGHETGPTESGFSQFCKTQ
jgi:hypothetical protein